MENAVTNAALADATAPAVPPVLVAIDGPAGSGKSSVSREAARRLGFGILDTGAAYRALAWASLEMGADLDDAGEVEAILSRWGYSSTLLGEPQIMVTLPPAPGDVAAITLAHDVTDAIRDPKVSGLVSHVSRHPGVREGLNTMFRRLVAESGLPGVIIEGRDITTVVAPDAPVRILLTASPEVRAARRSGELSGSDAAQVLADLAARDAKDAQVVDFFNPAPGVTLVDTSDLDFEGSVNAVISIVQALPANASQEDTNE